MDLILNIENDKIWNPGQKMIGDLKKVPVRFKKALLKYFTMFMADIYASELVRAIKEQRYKDTWEPLSEAYLKLKQRKGWSLNIWERTSLLVNSISFWSSDGGRSYSVGIKPGIKYKEENNEELEVRSVAQWMEYGTGERAEEGKGKKGWPGMPPRPLFRPLREHISRHISDWFSKFVDVYAEEIDELLLMVVAGVEVGV